MNSDVDNPESSFAKFIQTVQPLRDLESNWSVDLAKNLEEYLLKICSGDISGRDDPLISVNFSEAALVLQGSAQVYGRKVEYLYSLVLHALEFISQKSPEDQSASTSTQKDKPASHPAKDEEDDPFWGLDDIPVDAKNLLDSEVSRDVSPSLFVRPPANLIVLEGECLDGVGDDGELEAYLLATNDLYRDFILLDYCDAVTVDNFIACKSGKGFNNFYGGSSLASKGRKSFLSSPRRSVGSGQKLSAGKKHEAYFTQSPCDDHGFQFYDNQKGSTSYHFPDDDGIRDNCFEPGDLYDSDNDVDPWKHLDPHESGNLIVKPYTKVKTNRRLGVRSSKHLPVATEFPLAKLYGPIDPELAEIWKAKFHASEMDSESQPTSLYEKLRKSLVIGDKKKDSSSDDPEDLNEDTGYDSGDPDSGPPDTGMPHSVFNNKDIPPQQEKHDFGGHGMENDYDRAEAHKSLEDLCRTHLDALLANLSESERQTELASRVSTWKQRIEKNLEEQNARPPFDIHKYGERILDNFSVEQDHSSAMSFGDVVRGQEKHDVARTFSALLQLVNNGDVDLVKCNPKGLLTCYSDVNPFHVRLLRNEKIGVQLQPSKRRAKTPLIKGHAKIISEEEKENQVGKSGGAKCTPVGKKRRKSRIIGMNFAG